MFEILKKIAVTLFSLRKTVEGSYGRGVKAYVWFFYYSLLRRNTFIVFISKNISGRNMPSSRVIDRNLKRMSIDDLSGLRHGKNYPREFYCDKVHSFNSCYAMFDGNELAYIHWVYAKGDYSRFLKLKETQAEINNIFTLEPYRGMGLCQQALADTVFDLAQNGFQEIIAVVHSKNIASIKSFERAGFKSVYLIKTYGPFNRKITV